MPIKTIILLCAIVIGLPTSYASFNIATKGRVTGPAIHTTYFLTPSNGEFDVTAKAYVGHYINGVCVYNNIFDMGTEHLATGDFIDFDAFKLRAVLGVNYNCMSIYYVYSQLVIDNFVLINDGINYIGSFPAKTEVTIL